MTNKLPTLAAALAVLVGIGCGSKKNDDAKEEFPPSVTAPSEKDKTSTLPAKPDPEPAMEPAIEEPDREPAVVETEPTTYREMIAAGKRALADGDSQKALDMFTSAADDKPYAYPRIQMARALLQMGDHDQARTHAEAAVDMDSESTFAWNTLGRVELSAGELEAAITSFEHAVDSDPANSYAWNNLGFAFIEQERFQEAAEALENATSSASPTAYMWNNLGIAYEHLDLLDEARAAYRQATELGSDKASASLTRLEGVETIAPFVEDSDAGDPLELEAPEGGDEVIDGDIEDLNDAIVGC